MSEHAKAVQEWLDKANDGGWSPYGTVYALGVQVAAIAAGVDLLNTETPRLTGTTERQEDRTFTPEQAFGPPPSSVLTGTRGQEWVPKGRLDMANQRITELEAERAELRTANTKLRDRLDRSEFDVQRARAFQRNGHDDDLDAANERIRELEAFYISRGNAIKDLEAEAHDREQAYASLAASSAQRIGELQAQLDQSRGKFDIGADSDLDAANQRIEELEADSAQLAKSLAGQALVINDLQSELDASIAAEDKAQERIRELEVAIEQEKGISGTEFVSKTNLDAANQRIAELEAEFWTREELIKDLQLKVGDLEHTKAALDEYIAQLEVERVDTNRHCDLLVAHENEIRGLLKGLEPDEYLRMGIVPPVRRVCGRIAELEGERTDLQLKVGDLDHTNAALVERIAQLETENATLTEQFDQARGKYGVGVDSETGDESEFERLARTDWVVYGKAKQLHAVSELFDDPANWDGGPDLHGRTSCGKDKALDIPGLFTRNGTPRCPKCCDVTGMPHGIGSPKNDNDCRKILGLPVDEPPVLGPDDPEPPPGSVVLDKTGHTWMRWRPHMWSCFLARNVQDPWTAVVAKGAMHPSR